MPRYSYVYQCHCDCPYYGNTAGKRRSYRYHISVLHERGGGKLTRIYDVKAGYKNCTVTADMLDKTAKSLGMQPGTDFKIEKVTDLETIMTVGVLTTPAVSIDDQLVHSGSVPDADKVMAILK